MLSRSLRLFLFLGVALCVAFKVGDESNINSFSSRKLQNPLQFFRPESKVKIDENSLLNKILSYTNYERQFHTTQDASGVNSEKEMELKIYVTPAPFRRPIVVYKPTKAVEGSRGLYDNLVRLQDSNSLDIGLNSLESPVIMTSSTPKTLPSIQAATTVRSDSTEGGSGFRFPNNLGSKRPKKFRFPDEEQTVAAPSHSVPVPSKITTKYETNDFAFGENSAKKLKRKVDIDLPKGQYARTTSQPAKYSDRRKKILQRKTLAEMKKVVGAGNQDLGSSIALATFPHLVDHVNPKLIRNQPKVELVLSGKKLEKEEVFAIYMTLLEVEKILTNTLEKKTIPADVRIILNESSEHNLKLLKILFKMLVEKKQDYVLDQNEAQTFSKHYQSLKIIFPFL